MATAILTDQDIEQYEKASGLLTDTSIDKPSLLSSRSPILTDTDIDQLSKSIPIISQARPKTISEKIKGFFREPPAMGIAKAQNIYAISQETGISLSEVKKNYQQLARKKTITGISPGIPTKERFMEAITTPLVAVGLATQPIPTLAGLGTFAILNKLIPTEKFIPADINDDIRTAIELVDFIGKGAIVGGVFKKTPAMIEKFTKNKLTEYNLPKTIKLSAEQVRDIRQTGKLTSPEEVSLFGSLGFTSSQQKAALKQGVSINVPAEKIVRLADKPYWQKVKSVFGIKPFEQITTTLAGKPRVAPAGLLPEKLPIRLPPPIMAPEAKIAPILETEITPKVTLPETIKPILTDADIDKLPIEQKVNVPGIQPTVKEKLNALGFDQSWDFLLSPENEQEIIQKGLHPEQISITQEGKIAVISRQQLKPETVKQASKEDILRQIKTLEKQFNQALNKEDIQKASDIRQQIKQAQEVMKMKFPSVRKPKTLIGYIIANGGLDPVKLAKDYNVKLDFKEAGLLSVLKKGGRALDDFYDELVGQNLIPPAPENITPMDWVKQQITESKGKYLEGTKVFEKQLEQEYNAFVESEKVEGVTNEDVRAEQEAITQDIEKEIAAKSDEEIIGETNWRLEFYDEFAKRIETSRTPGELKDILDELTQEVNPTNKDAIIELNERVDERYREITKPLSDIDIAKIDKPPQQAIIPGTEPKMPALALRPPAKTELFQVPGELFANLPKSPSGNAMAGLWENKIPVEVGQMLYQLKPVEFPELVSFAKELMGAPPTLKKFPKVAGKFYGVGKGKIKLTPELFKQGNEQQLAIVLAHEIGHLNDYFPEYTLKRGNILGRLLTLHSFLKNTFGGLSVTNKEVKEELLKVTQHLHPYDETAVPAGYKAYRRSARELYAEAISLLLNSPGTIERLAPKFTKTFFDYLDKKPEVKEAYFGLQQLLSGKREDVLTKRQGDIRKMFVKGRALREQLEKERKLAKVNTWERIRQLVDDINRPILKKIQDNEAKGIIGGEVEYLLQENSLVDSENFLLVADIDNQIMHPLQKAGLELIDLEEYLFLRRVVGRPDVKIVLEGFEEYDENELAKIKELVERATDRKNIANPLGFAPQSAQEQLDFLKSQLGEEKFKLIEDFAQKFHDIISKSVKEAVKVGSYNMETFNSIIAPNSDIYVTFGVLNYLQNFVPATVKMQKGTLLEIESPLMTTILKTISLNRLNSRQRALNAWRDYWMQNFPAEIKKSKVIRFGAGVSKIIEPPRGSGLSSVKMLEDGKLVSYDVDEYIAKSFDTSKIGDLQLGMMLNKLLGNQIFKNLYITYNPGFAFAFNPIRDFKRTYVNLNALGYKVTIKQLLVEYARKLPDAIKRQKGITEGIIREMMENKALDIPFIDFNYDIKNDTYQHILERLRLLEGEIPHWQKLSKPLLKPLVKILEAIRFGGAVIETLPKVAGYSLLTDKKVADKQKSYFTREYVGTPNFRTKGEITSTTNAVWIFSNIKKEGLKRDLGLAVNPKTRGGWWWANIKVNLTPKFLMWLAASGVLGMGLKKVYDRMSEYDKTNYIVIPLGVRQDGRVVQLRIPHDETGRLISAIFWKTLNGLKDKELKQVQQIFDLSAGQLPGLAPAITMGVNWMQYLTGKNPYDNFRGRYIISETDWSAGGWPALKRMVQWTFNNAGLAQFSTYDDKHNTSFDTILQLTPIVNRLVKVTDYGLTEKMQRIRQEFKEKQAETTLLKREVFSKYAEEYRRGKQPTQLLSQIRYEVYGIQPITSQKEKALKEGFIKAILRDYNNPYINAFISAVSNEEKMKILKEMKETMAEEEYGRIVNTLKRFGY